MLYRLSSFFKLCIVSLILVYPLYGQAAKAPSAAQTKKSLLSIYEARPLTFLCETPFSPAGKIKTAVCVYCPTQESPVQWMAIVAPRYYLSNRACYEERLCIDKKGNRFGGIRCCRKKDEIFQKFEKDLHNLVPELPALKKLASQYRFGQSKEAQPQESSCYLLINKKEKTLEPDDKLKGMIGRTFLYLNLKYKLTLSSADKILYESWHREYPVSKWERERNARIKKIQGDGNPYVG